MLANKNRSRGWLVLLGLLVGAAGSAAQNADARQNPDNGYSVTEAGAVKAPEAVAPAGTQENLGPVRLARFSYVTGNVTWRTDENTDWSAATLNLPLRQGAQIWVSDGGRAEIQFDDGSRLRLGNGAVVTLQTLYSDSDGEFTELKLTDGLVALRLRHDRGVFQVNTPLASVKATGPASLRLGVGNGLEVAVKSGKATIEGAQGKEDLQGGDFLDLVNSSSAYIVRNIPRPDSWDQWNQERDDFLARAEAEPARAHLPADIAIVADDLNDYGTWRNDTQDGWVWCPRVSSPDWRPYHDGHWTWVNPFGWTWVASEAWGWAPYHYGTWVSRPYGWAWCPGPVNQYWSPAVVHFSECEGQVAWCPLAPSEVRYPASVGFGFRRGNWANYFSIGGAAVYYPTANGYCAPRVYDTRYVNRVTYVTKVTNVTNIYNNSPSLNRFGMSQESYAANNNTYLSGRSTFIPLNSRTAAGVTSARSADFGGRASYVRVARADTSLFTRGQAVGAPLQGRAPLAGPIAVKPTPQAMTPTRTFTPTVPAGGNRQARPVYRAPIAPTVAQNSASITPTGRVVTAPAAGFVKPTPGPRYPGGVSRNERNTPTDRASSVGQTNRGTLYPEPPGRVQTQPRGDGRDGRGPSQTDGTTTRPGTYPDKRSSGSDARGGASAAEAAKDARNSVGYPDRNRPTGRPAEGNSGNNGNTGNSGSDKAPRYPGAGGARGNGADGQKSAPGYPPRQTQPTQPSQPSQPAPPRNEPTRSEPRQTPAQRPEPARSDPPRQTQPAPPRSEPTRTEPTRNTPPPREPERPTPPAKGSDTNKDSGSKGSDNNKDGGSKGSDPTNRGRRGG
jgi:hypothetical protein